MTKISCDRPLRFKPLFRQYVWGGRRLVTDLAKPFSGEGPLAESWEIVDHGADQSIVSHGPLLGVSLETLLQRHADELLGQHAGLRQFPLLFKFLDARESLSVQVHPNDKQAATLDPPDLGKTEAWYVLETLPESLVYAGLKRGFDRPALEREINRNATELCLNRFVPQPGDSIFIPAGTVHALGGGLLIAEIQQASDTTFRIHDWNRLGTDGKPRPLHIAEALDVIDFDRGPVEPSEPQRTENEHVSRLVACDKFILDRLCFDTPGQVGGDDRFHIIAVVGGEFRFENNSDDAVYQRGSVTLLPAAAGAVTLLPKNGAVVLDAYLP